MKVFCPINGGLKRAGLPLDRGVRGVLDPVLGRGKPTKHL